MRKWVYKLFYVFIRQSRVTFKVKMFKFSVFVLFSCCAVQILAIPPHVLEKLPQEVVEYIHGLRKVCRDKFDLTDQLIDDYEISNNDEKYRCYMNCMLLESNWMSADGTIKYQSILDTMHPVVKPFLEAAFDKCKDFPVGSETCGKAYGFNVCLSKADPVHYFLA